MQLPFNLPTKKGWAIIGTGAVVVATAFAQYWLKSGYHDPIVAGAPLATWLLIILSHYTQSPADQKTTLMAKRAMAITNPDLRKLAEAEVTETFAKK
jgi:hypothetical protein